MRTDSHVEANSSFLSITNVPTKTQILVGIPAAEPYCPRG